MKTRVRIIKFFSFFCTVILALVFVLNYLNEREAISFPKALSFNFLNTLLGGIFASALVVLISEAVSYSVSKREMILTVLQILHSEYAAFALVSSYIKRNIMNDSFYVQTLLEKLTELIKIDESFTEVDISLLCNKSVTEALKKTRIDTGAFVSVFGKLYHSLDGLYDVGRSSISYDEKYVVITPTEPIRAVLLKIQEHSTHACSEINQAMISLDDKTIGYHWSERKNLQDDIINS